jgi:hypothetical protein
MSNEKEMSAVEWFNDEILIHLNFDQRLYLKHIYKKAKEMEKLKAFEIFKAGQDSMEEGGKGFENYYEQTYGFNK